MAYRRSLLFVFLLLCAACASGRSGSALYRRDVGIASGFDAVTLAQQVINRYGYEIETADTLSDIRIVTHWKARRPLQDEAALGVTNAETRLLITARPRGRSDIGSDFAITLQVENRLRVPGNPEWNEMLNTPMFRVFADEITNEYKRLVTNIGVRRYDR